MKTKIHFNKITKGYAAFRNTPLFFDFCTFPTIEQLAYLNFCSHFHKLRIVNAIFIKTVNYCVDMRKKNHQNIKNGKDMAVSNIRTGLWNVAPICINDHFLTEII